MNNRFELFESELLKEKYFRYTHECGLDIYVFPKKLSSSYAIFATNYGSIDNRFGIAGEDKITEVPDGIAHFLEHKLFTNEDGSDSFERFSELGADANAYTSFNRTAYLFSCTDNFAESLTELITFVTHPYFTEESVKKEQGIIAQEIKMYDDSPGEVCYFGMLDGLYSKHAIRKNICGSVKSIEKITPELLYECYRVFYSPKNMALAICADVTPEEVVDIVGKALPKDLSRVEPVRYSETHSESPEANKAYVSRRMQVAKPIFNIGIKDTAIPSAPYERLRKDAQMSILNEMIFSRAGELYQYLFEYNIISPEMSYCYTMTDSFAFNSISGEAENPERVLDIIFDHIETLGRVGLSREDFERSKRVMYAEFVKEFDSAEAIANNLLSFVFDKTDAFSYANIILDVTFEDVCELFGECFKKEYFTLSAVYPLDKE